MIALEKVSVQLDKPVLTGVSVSIPEGICFGLIGPGASGKSTLLKAVAGLVPATGAVRVAGQDLAQLSAQQLEAARTAIGMLFQNNALFDFMTVGENVAFPLHQLSDHPAQEIAERVSARLAAVGLPEFEWRMPGGLSGGQKKRVGVARATITEAKLLLYDEPTAGLDPVSSQKLFELLRTEQQHAETTAVMVSSDLDRLLSVVDRVGMLVAGELIFEGTPEEIRRCEQPHVRQFVRGELEGPL